ncbi:MULTISPECIES: flavin reductase [Vitreoscilla]|uniref:Flavin reductase n=1 Tax=Vitreoscilla stercoraria TaxID=61 RepID=A0ABY4E6J6_VITST|nr:MULTISPECIES: flavin reductase [Vitreoscilla]AUZ04953.1 FMN reductase [Vitreoscilla sp. C1]UOO91403.1 flavin reductase [Vitreoscilla stercoraria]
MVAAVDYRNAMSWFTSAVNVITTGGDSGRYGFTASAVCSVTDNPPTLLVCMNQSVSSHARFIENQTLAVNVLAAHQQMISQAFASKLTPEQRFAVGQWTTLATGSPVLSDALAAFDCEITQVQTVGTHSLLLCRVVAIQTSEQEQSLVYFNRAYYPIGHLASV